MEETKKQDANALLTQKMIDNRTILIYGEINQDLAKEVSSQLLLLASLSDDPITIFINSQGGHVEAGDTIHDMIKFVKPDVKVVGTGYVASAGITIYLAANKKDRYSLPNTRYMIHQPAGGVQGQSTEIQIEAQEIIRMRERINRLIAKATGQTYEQVSEDTDRNFWMSADEAVKYGIVTKIIEKSKQVK
ncbi:ATP-dependent Clp protease proteolytic subunit [Vagococcus carniphilus]|uniref:ATP-dependent Clp protease proteolytic subunit n=1 Tax=Vagococcus carniphilus TaxID=218144 RepID=A0AAW8U919_9ENTE|nr:ATP-dependent Clp protease proteolytic subunit [Vagococcus carniphilus]MDT2816089.1 ATP-dependent Clp protease proteolytic subunit [Vagococcus carniphilus]MDT2832229.1 ATP-dependent Clp protease proteolytic subunit [Vagococcus carniphilus]MDT2833747.1 ATP-dependent Clp protease proteolytic subunit [Vagococcus carniphilus]MDT2840687.1 ATP-dependent Clp protease proteolytic subunit [Vagococcus carniphilus]MDT2849616.1 ATP-dependent Clp protease proteolytic subunit [Vagococcus carniphilus]